MALLGPAAAALVLAMASSPWLFCQGEARTMPRSELPADFDRFVPGTIIQLAPDGGIRVVSTWPGGPADVAGICPGDEILAANGVLGSDRTFQDFLTAIVSDKPAPVDLKIKRGTQTLDFHVARVRESTLAALSEQKFARLPFFPLGERLVTVPLDESSEELQAFREFERRIGEHYGFKLAEGRWVPQATPESQLRHVAQVWGDPQSGRFAARLAPGYPYGTGFSVLLLKNPHEALVELIEPASPSYRAGLLPGDELLEVDGHSVAGLDQKPLADLLLKPSDNTRHVDLRIRRGAGDMTLGLETERRKDLGYGLSVFGAQRPRIRSGSYIVGPEVVDADEPRQAMVSKVIYPSPAFRAGLLVGDLILAANGKPVEQITRDQLWELLNPTSTSDLVLDVSRLDRKVRFRLTPVTEAQAQAEIGRKMSKNGPAPPSCTEGTGSSD